MKQETALETLSGGHGQLQQCLSCGDGHYVRRLGIPMEWCCVCCLKRYWPPQMLAFHCSQFPSQFACDGTLLP